MTTVEQITLAENQRAIWRAQHMKYYHDHKEQMRSYHRQYYADNRERITVRRAKSEDSTGRRAERKRLKEESIRLATPPLEYLIKQLEK